MTGGAPRSSVPARPIARPGPGRPAVRGLA
jgi:hypothetical protein